MLGCLLLMTPTTETPGLCVAPEVWLIWEQTLESRRLEFTCQIYCFLACFFTYKKGMITPPVMRIRNNISKLLCTCGHWIKNCQLSAMTSCEAVYRHGLPLVAIPQVTLSQVDCSMAIVSMEQKKPTSFVSGSPLGRTGTSRYQLWGTVFQVSISTF